jgi:hypothetical protein
MRCVLKSIAIWSNLKVYTSMNCKNSENQQANTEDIDFIFPKADTSRGLFL